MITDILLCLVGVVVGAMNAIAGGGMLIGFPVMLALGIPPLVANASSNISGMVGQAASAFGYREYLRRIPRRYALLLLPVALGAGLGATALRQTTASEFDDLVPLLVLFGVGLFAFQPLLHFHLHLHVKRRSQALVPLFIISAALLPISYYGGYFGVGYGFMMLAFLGLTNLKDAHMMNAMKNVAAVVISIVSVIALHGSGLINWRVGAALGVGSIIGGYFGARGAQKVSSHTLRLSIITIGLLAVIYLSVRHI